MSQFRHLCHTLDMTTMTAGGRVPEFTLGWRMRLALETGGLSVDEMAKRLGYSRSTISRWLNDKDEPRALILDHWSMLTGVDSEWLRNGMGAVPPPEPPGGRRTDKLAALTAQKSRRALSRNTTDQYLVGSATAA